MWRHIPLPPTNTSSNSQPSIQNENHSLPLSLSLSPQKGIKIGKILVHRHQGARRLFHDDDDEDGGGGNGGGGNGGGGTGGGREATGGGGGAWEGEEVVYAKLPADVHQRRVLLMDPVLGTGRTACRAIRVLLDAGVPEDRILLLCVVLTPEAAHRVCCKHPKVRVVASEIDGGLDGECRVVPGVGDYGDRYFSGSG